MSLCVRCHILVGRLPGREVTAGCVHEHLVSLVLCPEHEDSARECAVVRRRWFEQEQQWRVAAQPLWCYPCTQAGHPEVPVTILTAPREATSC